MRLKRAAPTASEDRSAPGHDGKQDDTTASPLVMTVQKLPTTLVHVPTSEGNTDGLNGGQKLFL